MPVTGEWIDRNLWLTNHIPYRVGAVSMLHWFLQRLLSAGGRERALVGVSVEIDGKHVRPGILTNAIIDAGLAHHRTLAEFLGFKVSRRRVLEKAARRRRGEVPGEDVWIEDFSTADVLTPSVTIDELRDLGIDEAIRYSLALGIEAVSHAIHESELPVLDKLLIATSVMPDLVKTRLYDPLNRPMPPCKFMENFE